MLNRSAVVVRPAQPFIEWFAGLGIPAGPPRLDDEPTVYLVPPFDDEAQGIAMLTEAHAVLFDRELYAWCEDETRWPANRDYATFRRWFQVVLLSHLEDVCEGPVEEEVPPDA